MPTPDEVLAAALALPDEDRIELIEALIRSVEPTGQPPLDETWRPIIARRSTELASGNVIPIPWSEVKRQARQAAGG